MIQRMMKRVTLNSSQGKNNNPYGSRHLFRLPAFFMFAGLFFLTLSGCAPPGDGVSENDNQVGHTTQREEEAAMKEESSFAEISRPPIDLELPDGLKTVTLAMG
jgi:hypothetical protein